jgi:polyisoprenoid-binding protein YceI
VHLAKQEPEAAIVRYEIDNQRSTFVAQAFSAGLLSAFGHDPKIAIREFKGSVQFTPTAAGLENAQLTLSIDAAALRPTDDISENDRQEIQRRMQSDVLETESFPEIVYECNRVSASGNSNRYWAALNGTLTLHGVTQPLPVSARVVLNGNSLRASGEFTVRQSAFGIKPASVAAGAIRIKDEIKCTFDIVAQKQEGF